MSRKVLVIIFSCFFWGFGHAKPSFNSIEKGKTAVNDILLVPNIGNAPTSLSPEVNEILFANTPLDQTQEFNLNSIQSNGGTIIINQPSYKSTEQNTQAILVETATSSNAGLAQKVHALYTKVTTENRLVEYLDLTKPALCPLGITKTLGGLEYCIVIESSEYNSLTGKGKLTASMSLRLPSSDKRLAFRAADIQFDDKGITGGGGKLILLDNVTIPFGSDNAFSIVADRGKTYVLFECSGYKRLGIDAELKLSKDLVQPMDFQGNVIEGNVKASFSAEFEHYGKMIASVSVSPFQLKSLQGFVFNITDATYDNSDDLNALGMGFPIDYPRSDEGNLWKGVFIRNFSITFPKTFQKTDKSRPSITVGASQVLIDENGFSGWIYATNLIPMDKGDMSGWPYSVDSVGLQITVNQIRAFGFSGRVKVAQMGEKAKPLRFTAFLRDERNYMFNIGLTGEQEFDIFSAKLLLEANSSITISVENAQFRPKANLNGTLSIAIGGSTNVYGLGFQGLQFQTVAPYVTIAGAALMCPKIEFKMNNFKIGLEKIGFRTSGNNRLGLDFTVYVKLTPSDKLGLAGKGAFTVWGKQETNSEGRFVYKYDGLDINGIAIDIDGGAFKIKGGMMVTRNDPVWGNSFAGFVEGYFQPGLTVSVNVQFGVVGTLRYWYADGLVILPTGIPISTGIALYGFGGGASMGVRQTFPTTMKLNMDEKKSLKTSDTTLTATPGVSFSGATYLPDAKLGLAIKAKVVFGTVGNPKPINGDVGFGIGFTADNGSVAYIRFEGRAFLMSDIGKGGPNSPASATCLIEYDFVNTSLKSLLEIFINFQVVKGRLPGNKAGYIDMYFAPEDWYIYVGQPDYEKRIGVKILSMFDIAAYMCMGKHIPEMPPPPPQVIKILGDNYPDSRDDQLTKDGGGFAFGASLEFSTGNIDYYVIYGHASAGAGFDMMLKDYGSDTRCKGQSTPVGMNGFYAKGQMYAYLDILVGVKVPLIGSELKVTVLEGQAAALMQIHGPNPTWFFGAIAVKVNVMDIIKGEFDFVMEKGEKCQLVGAPPIAKIAVISECSPEKNATKINVFTTPQATFNLPINKDFEMLDEEDNKQAYRVAFDYFKVSTPDGKELDGKLEWNAEKKVAVFNPTDVLPGLKEKMKLDAKVHFEQKKNGIWEEVKYQGKRIEESYSSTFSTAEEPDFIPKSNIAYSYPLINQFNFYKDEYNKGYIKLKQGQFKPFQLEPGFALGGRFAPNDGAQAAFKFTYDNSTKMIEYDLPKATKTNTVYQLQLLRLPTQANKAIDANVTNSTTAATAAGIDLTVSTKAVTGTLEQLKEKTIYDEHWFRVSKYETLRKKFNAMEISPGWNWSILTGVDHIGLNMRSDELLDGYELVGLGSQKKMIEWEADLTNNWMDKRIRPLEYPVYPIVSGAELDWNGRVPVTNFGVPPSKALLINQENEIRYLKEDDKQSVIDLEAKYLGLTYQLVEVSYYDYVNLQNKAVRLSYLNNQQLNRLLITPFSNILRGKYKLTGTYRLPGINKETSTIELEINNR